MLPLVSCLHYLSPSLQMAELLRLILVFRSIGQKLDHHIGEGLAIQSCDNKMHDKNKDCDSQDNVSGRFHILVLWPTMAISRRVTIRRDHPPHHTPKPRNAIHRGDGRAGANALSIRRDRSHREMPRGRHPVEA